METVTAEITGDGKHLVKVVVDTDGEQGTETAEIVATDGHPFWVPELGEWIDAVDLQAGQWLQTGAGTWVQITAIQRWTTQRATVHNLTVANTHTYYVLAGETPVLVYNCNIPKGFAGTDDYNEFVDTLNSGLSDAGYSGTTAAFQGSSVTGVSFKSGRPFGSHSDYDIALGGQDIFYRAVALGIPLRSGKTRTGGPTRKLYDL